MKYSKKLRILVGCEASGTVRDAFIHAGHDAMSCDLLPTMKPGPHYQGDIFDVIDDGWDIGVFHPPCTFLCSSGLHWNNKRPERAQQTEDALEFVSRLLNCKIPKKALENPIGCISKRIRKPDQIIQPHQFGADASKATCLWLQGLPKLTHTLSRLESSTVRVVGAIKLIVAKTSLALQKIAGCCAVLLTQASLRLWLCSGLERPFKRMCANSMSMTNYDS
jgi:hypothetical protein